MVDRNLLSMALDATAETEQLRKVYEAYAALEKLTAPRHADDPAASELDPGQWHAMLGLMNGGLHRQIELIESSVRSMRVALTPSALAPVPD